MPVGTPNKTKEKAAGVFAAFFTASWIFDAIVHLLDWMSRGETVLELHPYVRYLVAPWAILVQLAGAVWLLIYATRLEQFRETDEAPRVILAYTEPEEPKRHWLWLKLGASAAALSAILTLSMFLWWHHSHRANMAAIHPTPSSLSLPPPHYSLSLPESKDAKGRIDSTRKSHRAAPTTSRTATATSNRAASTISESPNSATVPPPIAQHATPQPPNTTSLQNPTGAPAMDSTVSCPPPGTISRGWGIYYQDSSPSNSRHPYFSFMVPGAFNDSDNPIHPFLRGMVGTAPKELSGTQLNEATRLFAELHARAPHAESIKTADGEIQAELVDNAVSRSFKQNSDSLQFQYAITTSGGIQISSGSQKVPIVALSPAGRQAVADFDLLSNSMADGACKDALHRLAAKPKI